MATFAWVVNQNNKSSMCTDLNSSNEYLSNNKEKLFGEARLRMTAKICGPH